MYSWDDFRVLGFNCIPNFYRSLEELEINVQSTRAVMFRSRNCFHEFGIDKQY